MSFIHFDSVGSTGNFNFCLSGSPRMILVLVSSSSKSIFLIILAIMFLTICHVLSSISFKSSFLKDSKLKSEGPAILLSCEVSIAWLNLWYRWAKLPWICFLNKRGLWLGKIYFFRKLQWMSYIYEMQTYFNKERNKHILYLHITRNKNDKNLQTIAPPLFLPYECSMASFLS